MKEYTIVPRAELCMSCQQVVVSVTRARGVGYQNGLWFALLRGGQNVICRPC